MGGVRAVLAVVLGDPEVRRVGALVEEERRAVRRGDVALLAGVCTGEHGRWGRICVLSAGHEDRAPHWGSTAEGLVAWIGSAPDDD
ncbi:hypothetical protein ACH4TY_18265 [Streptomyces anulatus]